METVEEVLARYEGFCRDQPLDQASTGREKPDVRDYTNLVLALGRHHRLEHAFERVERMVQKGPAPNTITYNALVNACCKAGDMELAGTGAAGRVCASAAVFPFLRLFVVVDQAWPCDGWKHLPSSQISTR